MFYSQRYLVVGITNYRIGPYRITSDYIELHWTVSDHVYKREIIISKPLHILTINCKPLVLYILKFIVGADRGAERAENQVEWSGAVSRSCRKTMEWSGRSRSGNGAGSGAWSMEREVAERGLERGAAFSPLTLRSRSAHAPLTRSSVWPEQTLGSLVRFGQM